MNKETDVRVFELVIKNKLLPAKLEELVPLSFVGQTAVNFYREKMALMKKLDMAEEQKQATLRDGQDAGKMLLAIEGRIGELSLQEPQVHRGRGSREDTKKPPKHKRIKLPSHQRMEKAQTIARHPEAVQAVIKEAEENEDIPTKTAVLTKIKLDHERERRKQAEAQPKNKIEVTLEQTQYINTLERIINLLPKEPPPNWLESAFQRAKGLASIIIKRLEVFSDGKESKNITS